MPNYAETELTINSKPFVRAYQITINYEYNKTPAVHYHREKVIPISETDVVHQDNGVISSMCDNMAKTIAVRDPITGELTGETITRGDIMRYIYSDFWQTSEEVDNPPQA